MHQKLVSDSFLILVNSPKQQVYARSFLENQILWKRVIKKILKKLTWFFLCTHSLLMDKIVKNKRGLELITTLSLCCKTWLEKYFFSDLSPGQFWWFSTKGFLSYFKHFIWKFMQANSQGHNYSSSIWPFEYGNCGKVGKKL